MSARSTRIGFGAAAIAVSAAAMPAAAQYYYGQGYAPGPYVYNAPPPPPGYYAPRPYGYADEVAPVGPRPLSPRRVRERLEDLGFDDVGRPQFTGTLYHVDATGPGDVRMRVTVDAIRGIVLNQVPLGGGGGGFARRGHDLDDFSEPRRYGARPEPGQPAPVESVPAPRGRGDRQEDARSERLPPPDGALPRPADPRLAPGGEARTPLEGRASSREASRGEPRTARVPAEGSSRPQALNPSSASPVVKPKPADTARRPDPSASGRTGETPAGDARTADAQRPNRPVRVIGGVTPMNPGGSTGGEAQLDNLPAPPAAPATGLTP